MKARRRILYVEQNTDGTVGGSHFSLLYLVEGLDKALFEPTVVFYQEHRLIPAYRQAGCEVVVLKKPAPLDFKKLFPALVTLSKNPISNVLAAMPALALQKALNYLRGFVLPSFECWQFLLKGRFDLLHLNNTVLRPQQWILASLFARTRAVAHERGINRAFPAHAFILARALGAIICISEAVRANLLRNGFPEGKLHLIYNGLDPDRFKPLRTREQVLAELGIGKAAPLAGIVGNIKKWKGQEVVIKAMRRMIDTFPDARCLVIGDASENDREYMEHVTGLIASEGLGGSVIITGYRKDVPDLVNCLDVLVHASVEPEPFGRVLLEGMALEKPVISNTIGSGPEIVVDGVTGLLVEPGDEESLAAALTWVFSDPERSREMGRAGRKRLQDLFHISENVKRTEELYLRLLP